MGTSCLGTSSFPCASLILLTRMALESQSSIGSWSPPDEGVSALQWVLWAVFVQIVMLAGGWTCFKVAQLAYCSAPQPWYAWQAVLPALRFCIKFCSALIADSNEDLEWEATMQRSREMKDAKKRDNERREAERQAAKALEREKRKRKVKPAIALPGVQVISKLLYVSERLCECVKWYCVL